VVVGGGLLKLNSGAVQLGGGVLSGGNWSVSGSGQLDFGTTSIIGNAANLSVGGLGQIVGLNALSSNSGSIALSGGASLALVSFTSNSGVLSVGSQSTLTLGGSTSVTFSGGTVLVASASSPANVGRVILGNDLTTSASPSAAVVASTGALANLGVLDLNGTRTFNIADGAASVDLIVAANLANGSLIKSGPGVMRLDAQGDFASATVSAGVLRTGAIQVLPQNAALHVGSLGTVDLAGFRQSVAALEGAGSVTLGGASLTINGPGFGSFGGSLSGAGMLLKGGTGSLTLAGNNSFAGGVQVDGGLLAITATNSFTGSISLNGGTVSVGDDTHLGNVANAIHLSGGALRTGGSFSSARSLNISGGTIDTAGTQLELSSGLSGDGVLNKSGPGTLRLSGVGSLSGHVRVFGGNLGLIGGVNVLPAVGSYTVNVGATLELDTAGGAVQRPGRFGPESTPADIHLDGGTFSFTGQASTNSTQTLGTLFLDSGASSIVQTAGAGGSTELTFAALTRNSGTGATVDVSAIDLGNTNKLKFTSGVSAGFIGGWFTINGSDFATYDATDGVIALDASSSPDYVINVFTADKHVLLRHDAALPDPAEPPASVTSVSIHTLKIDDDDGPAGGGSGTITVPQDPGSTLTLGLGGLIKTGPNTSVIAPSSGVATLTSGATELNINVAAGTLSIQSVLSGFSNLTKRGEGVLKLESATANNYSGMTMVSGALELNSSVSNGAIPGNLVISGGTVISRQDEQIANSASITLSAGTFDLNGHSETVANLVNDNGTVLLNGGILNVTSSIRLRGGFTRVASTLIGGTGSVQISGGDNTVGIEGVLDTGSGTLVFDQPNASIILTADSTNPGRIVLGSDVQTTHLSGTATIGTTAGGATAGVLDLGSATRSFTIALGTAPADMQIDAIVANGGMVKSGEGALKLTAANSYGGGTRLLAGTFEVGSGGLGSGSVLFGYNAGTTTNATGTLSLRTDQPSASFSGNDLVAADADRAVRVDIERTTPGQASFPMRHASLGLDLTVTGSGTLGLVNVALIASKTTVSNFNTNVEVTGIISGASGLELGPDTGGGRGQVRRGSLGSIGTLAMTGSFSNTYTGNTTINSGVIAMQRDDGATVIPGNLFVNGGTALLGSSNQISDSSSVTLRGGAAVLNVGSNSESISALNLQGGQVIVDGGTLTVSGSGLRRGPRSGGAGLLAGSSEFASLIDGGGRLHLVAPVIDVVDGPAGDDLVIAATLSTSSSSLSKIGDGNLVLSGNNTPLTGSVTISGGVLTAASSGAFGSASVVLAGGVLQLRNLDTGSLSNAIILGSGAVIDVPAGSTVPFGGVLSGSGGLSKTGGGTLELNAPSNSFSGTVSLNAGTLSISSNNQLGDAGNLLKLWGTLHARQSLATARSIELSGGGFDVAADQTLTLDPGPLSGSGGLIKSGPGTLLFNRSNSYSGTTSVTGGQLIFTNGVGSLLNGSVLSGGAWVIGNNATLDINAPSGITTNQASITLRGPLSTFAGLGALHTNSGQLRLEDGHAFTTAADLTNSGSITLASGAVLRTIGALTSSGPIAISAGSLLRVDGVLSNTGTIDILGSLIIDYTDPAGTLLDDTRAQLLEQKLTSSSTVPLTRVGFGDNAVLGKSSFAGQPVDASSLLLKLTYAGDTDLDGDVDIADLGNLASNWQTADLWTGGDFDYNGTVNVNDLGLLASNWQAGVANPLAPESLAPALRRLNLPSASVPEPAAASLAAGPTLMLRRLRRRRVNAQ
jgi:autotransporter-associated beta strand protein